MFQDSQLDGLSKDIFGKLGALGSACLSSLAPWGVPVMPNGHPLTGGRVPPQHGDSGGSPWVSSDCARWCLWFLSQVEHIGLEEMIGESVEAPEEVGQKRRE